MKYVVIGAGGTGGCIDGLVFEPVRMAERFGADLPTYRRIATALGMTE